MKLFNITVNFDVGIVFCGSVLVYDITRKTSFEELKNYWFREIKENAQSDVSKKKF